MLVANREPTDDNYIRRLEAVEKEIAALNQKLEQLSGAIAALIESNQPLPTVANQATNSVDNQVSNLELTDDNQVSNLELTDANQVNDQVSNLELTDAKVNNQASNLEIPDDNPVSNLERSLANQVSNSEITVDNPHLLSGVELAKRLGVSEATVRHQRNRNSQGFGEWSCQRDPEGISWEFDPTLKKYHLKEC